MRLTVRRGSASDGAGGKTALCLCGGGITGALFEVGVLAGLDDVLGRVNGNEFDIYVGSSAGASVASLLAQGVTAGRVFEALRDPRDPFFPLGREQVYHARWTPWLKSAARLAVEALRALATLRVREPLAARLARLQSYLPQGLFSTDRYEEFLRAFFARENLSNRFGDLSRELYIVANEVDSPLRVVFGDGDLRGVEIATAVAASSAIPLFFEPVRIAGRDYFDGSIGRVDPIDVAIAHGADRVVVVNPVVPVRIAGPQGQRVRERGPIAILDQARRITTKACIHLGITRNLARHAHAEILLIEPSETDTDPFGHNPMSLCARSEILDYARSSTRHALWKSFDEETIVEQLANFTNAANRDPTVQVRRAKGN
jgi:predicted acylesterase/phospholipase RssA